MLCNFENPTSDFVSFSTSVNVISTLIHNVETTLIRRWNVGWDIFWRCLVVPVTLNYWSKCHVSIITDSGVMTIFLYKGLTRNPEIANNPVRVLPNIWRVGRVGGTKFSTNISNEMFLNAAKCQGYSFFLSELLRRNQKEGG